MTELEKERKEDQIAVDKVSDELFADFCKKVGISSIKEFEGSSLREINEKIMKKENLKGDI
jgi:hypothetical protein